MMTFEILSFFLPRLWEILRLHSIRFSPWQSVIARFRLSMRRRRSDFSSWTARTSRLRGRRIRVVRGGLNLKRDNRRQVEQAPHEQVEWPFFA
jgi:hypothetical protein